MHTTQIAHVTESSEQVSGCPSAAAVFLPVIPNACLQTSRAERESSCPSPVPAPPSSPSPGKFWDEEEATKIDGLNLLAAGLGLEEGGFSPPEF